MCVYHFLVYKWIIYKATSLHNLILILVLTTPRVETCHIKFARFTLLSSNSLISIAVDTLRPNQVFTNGQTMVSSSQRFELGFFSPGSSKISFLGIPGSSLASLTLGSSGFSISTNESLIVWSVNVSVV
ncbi:putative bulb-type lectin domain-containing protein [Rosa chinensis]|uniref:Putative bulb-type lectin domain-containing protein n=1 Tax=Rosa chinensis TaxID=74649 RepID=A0A2P6QL61_ROSCH|nr:putative bulb-type lectin domain-containing protein [Rosa chinensis]